MPSSVGRAPRTPDTFDAREPLTRDVTPRPDPLFFTPKARRHQRKPIVIAVPERMLMLPAPAPVPAPPRLTRLPLDLPEALTPPVPRDLTVTSRIAGHELAIRAAPSQTSASLEAQVSGEVLATQLAGARLSGSYALSTNVAASADPTTGRSSSSFTTNARASLTLANRVTRELEVYAKADVDAGANPTLFSASRALTTNNELGFSATSSQGYGTLSAALSVRSAIQDHAVRAGIGFTFGYLAPF